MSSQKASYKRQAVARVPRRRRGEVRSAILLQAGAEVLVEKGYDAATMTEIASRAGASIGSLYQYFPTKDVLADVLRTRIYESYIELLDNLRRTARGQSIGTVVGRLFRETAAFFAANPVYIVLNEERGEDRRRTERRAQTRNQIAAILREVMPSLPTSQADILANLTHHLVIVAPAMQDEQALDELSTMLTAHLTRRRPSQSNSDSRGTSKAR